MGDNLTIKVGLNASAVKTGLSAIRDQFGDLKKFAGNQLVQTFGAVGIASGIGDIIEKGSQINDLAARFGLSAEGMQRIGNAASQNGASLESAAAGMNKLALAQEKVRTASPEATAALNDLGISAQDFINLSPEEAFYKVSDAVANADDRGKAYAAVIQLMGKSSGELFTTLEMGSDAIRELGDSVGVMSDDTIAHLDDLGDAMDKAKGRFAASAGGILVWVDKMAQSTGAILGGMWMDIKGAFGGYDAGGAAAAATAVDEIWNPKKDESDKKKPRRDVEEEADKARKAAAEKERSENKIATLRERLAAMQQEAMNAELEGQSKINALIEQRDKLLKEGQDANAGRDAEKELEAKLKAAEIDKQIVAERKKVDAEAERDAESLAKKQDQLREKAFRNSLDGKTDEEKKTALAGKRAELMKKLDAEKDPSKRADIGSDILDLDSQINNLGKKKESSREVVAGDLTRKGLGGVAYFAPDTDPAKRAAKAAEKTATVAEKSQRVLEKIEENIKEGRWAK